ncbi:MAG: Wzz/FepE/Etk N-terminal domain-containing protein [Candidatus Sulfotelmatobacter sp.]
MRDQDFTQAQSASSFGFTLRDLLAIGFRHKRAFLLCFVGILLGTLAAVLLLPATYESTAQIVVKRERVDPVVTAEKNDPTQVVGEVTEEELNSEAQLVLSEDVLRKAVIDSGLDKRKTLLSSLFAESDDQKIAKAVDKMKGTLRVEPLKKTNVVQITYSAHDAKLAAKVLNNVISAYVEKHVAVNRPPGQLKFFEEETDRYKHDLDQAEEQLKKFSQEQSGVAPQISRDMTLQKLNDFSAALEQTRAEMSATEQKILELQKQAGITPDRLTTQMRETDNGAVLQQLKTALLTLELKRTELLTKFQPGYRLVLEVDKQIADTHTAITAEESKPLKEQTTDRNPTYAWINEELAKAKSDYSALQARATATQAIVGVYQGRAHQLEVNGFVQQDLLRTAKANEDNYLLYLHKREEARIADALDQTRILNIGMVQQPTVPLSPTRSPVMFGLVGVLMAGMVSAGLVFTKEYLDSSFRTPSEVLSELNIPVLAAVPLSANRKMDRAGGAGKGNGTRRNGTPNEMQVEEAYNSHSVGEGPQ